MKLPAAPPKAWFAIDLYLTSGAQSLGMDLEHEWRFHPERKWRLDWAIPAIKLGVEYDGLMSGDASHASIRGILRDAEKLNEAQLHGWIVIRVNAKSIYDDAGTAFRAIDRAVELARARALEPVIHDLLTTEQRTVDDLGSPHDG